jgi:nicotinamidase-related amidase
MKTALLIVDIQNDYFPSGKGELYGPLEAAMKARQLLQCFREHKQPTVHIQHLSTRPGATIFIPGTEGANIHDSVAHYEGEPLVQKHFPNSFRETELLELLKGWEAERIIVCGMMTHMCVDATARAGADLGFQLIVAADACATKTLTYGETDIPAEHVQKAFLAALKSYGQVLTVEEIITHLAVEMTKS